MAQKTADSITAPRAWVVYAWLDAALHPKFATFQRWFPLMKTRWRMLSLIVSLIIIIITVFAHIALAAYSANLGIESLAPSNLSAYLASPSGLFRVFFYGPCSFLTLFAIPAAVALISPRSLGPYAIRFKRVFRPWMQIQPTICALLLFSTVAELLLTRAGIYESENPVFSLLSLALVPVPALATFSYTIVALSAGSGLTQVKAGWVAAIPGILVQIVFWILLAAILNGLGRPVL